MSKKIGEYLAKYNQLHSECDELYRDYATKIGLSDCAFWIIYFLGEADDAPTQSEMVETIHIPKQTINSSLKKLEKDNLVRMEQENGKRGKRVFLTKDGENLFNKSIFPIIKAEAKASKVLTNEEMTIFLDIFSKYAQALKKELKCVTGDGSI